MAVPDMDMGSRRQMSIPQGLNLFVARPATSLQRSATTTAVYGRSPSFPKVHLQTQQHASIRPFIFNAQDGRCPSALLPPLPTKPATDANDENGEDWEADSFQTELEETASLHPSMEVRPHLATEMERVQANRSRSSTNLSDLITRALTLQSALDKGRRPASEQWWHSAEEARNVHHNLESHIHPTSPCSSSFEEFPARHRRKIDLCGWRFGLQRTSLSEKCLHLQSRRVCGVHRWMCVVAMVFCMILVCIAIIVPLSLTKSSTQGPGSPKTE